MARKKKNNNDYLRAPAWMESTKKAISRVLKDNKLFGLYMMYYDPPYEDAIIKLNQLSPNNSDWISVYGIPFRTSRNGINKKVYLAYHYLVRTRKKEYFQESMIPDKIKARTMLSYLCSYYFNKHKDEYRLKCNQLKFETIFGVIFAFIGLTALCYSIYNLIGYGFLVAWIIYISLIAFVGQTIICKI